MRFLPGLLLFSCVSPREGMEAGECNDYLDNDGNGLVDCEEVLCSEEPDCGGSESDADGDADGAYVGTLTIDVVHANLALTDTCSGSISLAVSMSSSPHLSETLYCSFSGDLRTLIPSLGLTLEGSFSLPTGSGTVEISEFSTSDTWTGALANGSLEGAFSGRAPLGVTIDYAGSFQTTRVGGS